MERPVRLATACGLSLGPGARLRAYPPGRLTDTTGVSSARMVHLCGGGLTGPKQHVRGFLAAVAAIDAFVQIDELIRWPGDHDPHAITAACRADADGDGW